MQSNSSTPYDIVIVGLGPVGATAALLFAHEGLRVAVVERDKEIYALPRAVAMDGEVVRGFQRIGLGYDIASMLQAVREGDRAGFANSRREWLFGQDMQTFGTNGWQPMAFFDQPELDSYLRTTALAHANVTGHVGAEMLGFEDLGNLVEVRIRDLDSGTEQTLRGSYLLGCDGAASSVRRGMNAGWHDLGYDHDWLVVDVTVKPGHQLGVDTIQVCDPDRLATYVATKDPYRRWEFKLNAGETREEMLDPDRIRELLDPWTPADTYELRRTAVYQFHAAIADRWQVGRVLLAGDAAHQTPPFLGQGMNAGMRDAINLAWKLPLVIAGSATADLLASYEAERAAHATDLVDWAVNIGQLMEHLAATEAAQRAGDPAPVTPEQRRASGYGQGRENPPLRDGVIIVEQVSDEGSTGYLFSQPLVEEDGAQFRLDARLGRGFALVARTPADLAMSERSRRLVAELGISMTALAGLTEVRGHFDRLFDAAAVALVRPDRYVFGHTTATLDLDGLLALLAEKLSLVDPGTTPTAT